MGSKIGDTGQLILDLLGRDATVALAENFAGTRLYVPARVTADNQIVTAVGLEAAKKLSKALAPDAIRIPLYRELRAVYHRERGLSNARIAVRLGITESGVNRLFQRLAATDAIEPR